MADYKIELGVSVDKTELNNLKSQIESLDNKSIKIKLDDSVINTQIGNIETRLRRLDSIKIDLGNSIKFDTNAATKSVQQVGQKIGTAVTKDIQKSLNFDDSIVSNQVTNLMKNAGIAAKKGSKDFKVAFDEIKQAYVKTMSGMGSVDDVIHAIAKNVKRVDVEKQDALRPLLNQIQSTRTDGSKILIPKEARDTFGKNAYNMRASLGNGFVFKNGSQDLENYITENLSNFIDMSKMTIDEAFGELVSKYYEAKNPYYSVDELFSSGNLNHNAMADEIVASFDIVRNGQSELTQSSNTVTDAVVQDSKRQQEAIKANLEAKKVEIEQEKKRLAEINKSIEDNNRNYNEATIAGDEDGMSKSLSQMDVLDERAKKQEEYIRTLESEKARLDNEVNNISKADFISDTSNTFKEMEVEIGQTENKLEGLKIALKSLGLNDASVDDIIKDFEKLGVTAKKVSAQLNDDGLLKLSAKGINADGDTVTATRNFGVNGDSSWNVSVTRKLTETEQAFNRLKYLGKEISQLDIKIAGLDVNKNKSEINELTTHLNKLESEYDDLFNANEKNFSSVQIDELVNDIVTGSEKLDTVKAKIADIRNELAKSIKADIELGNFDNQMDAMRTKFNSLFDANDDLRRSFEATENAYKVMTDAAKANSGDEVADRERLIQVEKEYAATLEKTDNLIKQQARADKINADSDRLEDKRKSLSLDMQNWLKNNTKAAKEYGDEIRRLDASLDELDDIGVNKAGRQFKNITKDAERRGLTGLTWFDQIKTKFKEYASYFSVAEMFMYAEQGLRSMFEQVKLIDSAMTELKKVTDESDASYNRFLSNAANRAKEIGTTIDGLVASTADFARLGYDFEQAAGLAEVANIYTVVGDEIDGVETATQSLVSTLAAFKNEMGDMSDSDFAMSIVDKFNEVSNNFAISSGGIGEALQRSASSLAAANNTIDESIALITAANTVVQNPEKVGKLAMPT